MQGGGFWSSATDSGTENTLLTIFLCQILATSKAERNPTSLSLLIEPSLFPELLLQL